MRQRSIKEIFSDVRAGIFIGLAIGSLLGIFVGVTHGFSRVSELNISYLSALVFYVTAFPIAGAIVGALRPLNNTLPGRMLLGFLAMLPIGYLAFSTLDGNMASGFTTLWKTLGFAAVLGPLGAAVLSADP
jgi:hypothetical protein